MLHVVAYLLVTDRDIMEPPGDPMDVRWTKVVLRGVMEDLYDAE